MNDAGLTSVAAWALENIPLVSTIFSSYTNPHADHQTDHALSAVFSKHNLSNDVLVSLSVLERLVKPFSLFVSFVS